MANEYLDSWDNNYQPAVTGATQGVQAGSTFGPWGAAIGGALGAGYGLYQMADAAKKNRELKERLKNLKRPEYQIPGEIGENTAMYRNMAGTSRIPGQNIAENNLYQAQSNTNDAIMKTGRNQGQILASLVANNQNTTNRLNDLAVQGANMQIQNKNRLAQQLGVSADYADKAWDLNKFQPYSQELDALNRGFANNRQQQQQGAQTLINAGSILGGVYDMNRANRVANGGGQQQLGQQQSWQGNNGNQSLYGGNTSVNGQLLNNNQIPSTGASTPIQQPTFYTPTQQPSISMYQMGTPQNSYSGGSLTPNPYSQQNSFSGGYTSPYGVYKPW